MRIISDIRSMDIFNKVCRSEIFLQEQDLHYRAYRGSFRINDLRNALKTGKTCPSFSVEYRDECDWLNLVNEVNGDLSQLLALLDEATDLASRKYVPLANGLTVHRTAKPGVRMFSPFALERLKPLAELPSKWMLSHVRRALANGQIENLRCDGITTDDYAFDNATNFQKGKLETMKLLRDLIESPDGWWTTIAASGKVGVSCHSFEHHSFTLKLENRQPAFEAEILG